MRVKAMTSIYEIHKANRIGRANDFWTALVAQKWKASEEEFKEYTGSVPVTINANGSPLISWSIYGNTVQSTTPTPQNPVMPEGCGKRTGNLFDKNSAPSVGWYCGSDDIIRSSTAIKATYIPCSPNTTYTIAKVQSARFKVAWTANEPALGVTYYGLTNVSGTSVTVTTGSTAAYLYIEYYTSASDTYTEAEIRNTIMLNTGSTPLPYEPYGYKIPISSASTTTPIYLGEVESTRRIKKLVLTGQETEWRITGTGRMACVLPTTSLKSQAVPCICSHYIGVGTSSIGSINNGECSTNTSGNEYVVYDTNYTTIADFKSYLAQQYAAGTPVTVWYVLATEETGIVNEPSEVYIKYKGR